MGDKYHLVPTFINENWGWGYYLGGINMHRGYQVVMTLGWWGVSGLFGKKVDF